jgi:Asp-tRNA(Asn)/Glu-tRNA(Gln) amidotransferase A subunit family amidase
MPDSPWLGDACSLVDAYRRGERSPLEELDAVSAAIEVSELNAFCHLDMERARQTAEAVDLSLPFAGVPMGIKELEAVTGWPAAEASLVFAERLWEYTTTQVDRLVGAGAVLVGQTTSSEFGGLNVGMSRVHGMTRNPWSLDRTPGGSSAGSSAAVAGGLVPIASGGDGGGSIRIPAGFCGLLGMKGTAGRIPRGPQTSLGPLTIVVGCMARSVRDVARWYEVCAGYHGRDPYSLPRVEGWERDLGRHDLSGKKVVIAPTLGPGTVRAEVEDLIRTQGELLAKQAGLQLVDLPVDLPPIGLEWALANLVTLREELGPRWPDCKDDLTPEIAFGMMIGEQTFNLEVAGRADAARQRLNNAMGDLLEQVDFIIAATNPDVAFPADIGLNTRVGDLMVGPENNGVLTQPANITGVPAVSIPVGTLFDLPVGLQVIGRHHADQLLLDLALVAERTQPWPLVAPGAPR